jgi:hypothetical protein
MKVNRFVEPVTAAIRDPLYAWAMTARYYTHFVTADEKLAQQAEASEASEASEWSGVVELRHALEPAGGTRELCALLAQSFDLNTDDIRILHWARLH